MNTSMKTRTQAPTKPSFTPVQGGLLQRKCACGGSGGIAGECEECSGRQLMSDRRRDWSASTANLPPIGHAIRRLPDQTVEASTAFGQSLLNHNFGRVRIDAINSERPQAKLVVGEPDDQYEKQAERVASEIAGMSSLQIKPGPGEELSGWLGQTETCGGRFISHSPTQKSLPDRSGSPDGGDPQAQSDDDQIDIAGGGFGLTAQDEAEFQSIKGQGQPLASAERGFMEPRFGHSFGQVRIHNDARADQLARGVGARALTVGQDIVFRQGEYNPASADGRHLLAHELTHVLQQSSLDGSQSTASLAESRVQRYLVGPPQFVGATTTTPETYGNCRAYNWVVDWSTTSLQDGFIIQEITNAGAITRCDGTNVPPPNTPHFWEAWPVTAGTVGDGGADQWFRAQRSGTRGNWRLSGDAFAVGSLDPAWGFTAGGVADANGLRSTTTGPNKDKDLYQPSLSRTRAGVWDCCDGNNYHRPA